MGKKSTARAVKPQRKSKSKKGKAADKPPRLVSRNATPEELSYADRQRKLHDFVARLRPKNKILADAKANVDDIYAEAKEMGFTKKRVDRADALTCEDERRKQKALDEAKGDNELIRMCNLQGELQLEGGEAVSRAERFYKDGTIAAQQHQMRKPPSYLNDEDGQHWMNGHADATEVMNKERQAAVEGTFGGFKPVADAAAAAVDSLTTEEHREAA